MPRRKYSRLVRNQRGKNIRTTVFWLVATVILVGVMIWAGVPAIVKAVAWWGDWQTASATPADEDVLPPSVPRIAMSDTYIGNSSVDVRGFAEPGSTLQLFVNGQLEREVLVESNGQFLVTEAILKNGENQLFAMAIDEAGNQSKKSEGLTVTVDTEAPTLEVLEPVSGTTFSGDENQNVEVRGITEPNLRVWVGERLARVEEDGTFRISIRLNEGEQMVTVKAIDQAENEATVDLTLTYQP